MHPFKKNNVVLISLEGHKGEDILHIRCGMRGESVSEKKFNHRTAEQTHIALDTGEHL